MNSERYACATLVSTESYVIGARVLGHSLHRSGWGHETLALVTPQVGPEARQQLGRFWQRVIEIQPVENPHPPAAWGLPTFATMFTKLRLWERTEYRKLIYLDADTVVLGGLQELLERPRFAAAPCLWPPDTFNAGVLVLEPSLDTFDSLMAKIGSVPSHDGSDQGFFNEYFSDWFEGPPGHRLPARYNVSQFLYFYKAAWNRLRPEMRVLHYTDVKPWKSRSRLKRKLDKTLLRRLVPRSAWDSPSPLEIWWDFHSDLGLGTSRVAGEHRADALS